MILCLVLGFSVVVFGIFSGSFSLLGVAFSGVDGLRAMLVVFPSSPI
jgi:hypothetical protein